MHYPRRAWALNLLKLMGWQVNFNGLPIRSEPDPHTQQPRWVSRGVLIAYPHTSNWDGVIGVLAVWGLGLRVTLWGKADLFRVPLLASLLKSAGAVAVSRTQAGGVVGSTVRAMRHSAHHWLALAPEGTRKRLPGWRTGFYQVATQAQVPVGVVYLDWGRKRIGVTQFLTMSGDVEADFAQLRDAYHGVVGRCPEAASDIAPLDAAFSRASAVVDTRKQAK